MNRLDQTTEGNRFIVLRLWRGQEPSVVVYWIVFLVGTGLWRAAYEEVAVPEASIGSFLLWVGLCGFLLFPFVGLWRAARRNVGTKRWVFRTVQSFCLLTTAALLAFWNNSNLERKLVGTWQMNMDGTAFEMTLASDHTYLISYTGRVTNAGSGQWTLNGNQLVVKAGAIPLHKASVRQLDYTNLVIQDAYDGRTQTWTRFADRLK